MQKTKELIEKLKKDYDNFLFLADSFLYNHQSSVKIEFISKAMNIKEQIAELESSLSESDVPTNEKIEAELKKIAITYANDNGYDYDEFMTELVLIGAKWLRDRTIPTREMPINKTKQ